MLCVQSRLFLLMLLLIQSVSSFGQIPKYYNSPDMENVFAHETGAFANLNAMRFQPSSLTSLTGWKLGIGHRVIFSDMELNQKQISCYYGEKNQRWSVFWQKEGNNELKFSELNISSARNINEKWHVGVMVGALTTKSIQYKSAYDIVFKLGWTWLPAAQMTISSCIENLIPGISSSRRSYAINSTICIIPTTDFQIKIINIIPEVSTSKIFVGFSYQTKFLYLQLAASITDPVVMAATGLLLKHFTFELHTKLHQQLGISPGITVHFAPFYEH